jgi:hypothetical protein
MKKILVLGVFALIIAAFFVFDLGQYLSLEYIKSQQASIDAYYQDHRVLTWAAYMAVYIVITAASLPGAAVLTVAAGALFGLLTGVILVSFASTIGATCAFLVSRFILRDTVQEKFADKLRTITQEVAAATCFLHNDLEVPLATEVAQYGLDQFDVLTLALLEGDDSLGIIGGEENRRARAMIEDFRANWAPVHAAVVAVLEDPSDTAAVDQVHGLATAMLETSMDVLSKVESVHVIPSELLHGDAMLLDVAGRQALLTQRLSFLACKKWSGAGNDAYDELLRAETAQYIFGFEALLNGAPQLGISAPPNAEIANALGSINADFSVVKTKLNALIETQSLERDQVGELGFAAIGPVLNVVRISVSMMGAAAEAATLVSQSQCSLHGWRYGSGFAAHIEDFAVFVFLDGYQSRITADAPYGFGIQFWA